MPVSLNSIVIFSIIDIPSLHSDSDFAIIGILWEIFEVYVEGTEETYGTKKKWAYNTGADLLVEIGAAAWMVW